MKKYSSFIFDSFDFDQNEGKITLRYSLDEEENFTETISLPAGMQYQPVNVDLIDRALFALHLTGGTSYYKTCCPETLEVRSGTLSEAQANFFSTVYTKGLSEFFYQNKLTTPAINFPVTRLDALVELERPVVDEKSVLVPFGGGKDSFVTAEILKKAGYNVTLLRVGPHPLIDKMIEATGLPSLTIERSLSPNLFALNEQGALNGHVPITAYISCLTVLIALLYGYKNIAFSNERSASIGNTQDVNHQWSKSLEFETTFRNYIQHFISTDIEYFSLLRHLDELLIAKYMSGLTQYHSLFTSCNKNWKIAGERPEEKWCRDCPKCAFSYALFAAHLPRIELEKIFGETLFTDPGLTVLYRELLGLEGIKPFECVGTPEETTAAFLLAHERGDLEDTVAMQIFVREVLPTIADPEELKKKALTPGSEHHIPEHFLSALHAH